MFSSNASQVSSDANFIEDVFSTYLYTGNGSTQTITNGIDLAGEGGLVWLKSRSAATNNFLFDTSRGVLNEMNSNNTEAQASLANSLTAFNANGFSLGSAAGINVNAATYASWTFRKQPKFFDVVTYTGNGATNRQIAHNLGSTPGCIIVKRTDGATNWVVYHRSLTDANYVTILNSTIAQVSDSTVFGTAPTDTVFTVARTGVSSNTNQNGATYVAYLFAHDAGGFGLTGTDNVISCGSYTTDGSGNATVNLGYEFQWLLRKRSDAVSDWIIVDNMRGWASSNTQTLAANNSDQEFGGGFANQITSTGFSVTSDGASRGYIYIAIRRGPMKVPESGTEVFALNTLGGTAPNPPGFNGVLVDWAWKRVRNTSDDWFSVSRLTGTNQFRLNVTDAATDVYNILFDYQDGWLDSATSFSPQISWMFKRAPSFMDVVCYTGNSTDNRTVSHNLGVAPELVITKSRNAANDWEVWTSVGGLTQGSGYRMLLQATNPWQNSGNNFWGTSGPNFNSSTFLLGDNAQVNSSARTYVAYLFATCPGVSKVGSYTGTGALQTINCGFTTGARFILIKRTDTTGDWWTYNSLRGISSGSDLYMFINSTAAEVGGTNYVDTTGVGFQVTAAAPVGLNASGGTYIFLAIA